MVVKLFIDIANKHLVYRNNFLPKRNTYQHGGDKFKENEASEEFQRQSTPSRRNWYRIAVP